MCSWQCAWPYLVPIATLKILKYIYTFSTISFNCSCLQNKHITCKKEHRMTEKKEEDITWFLRKWCLFGIGKSSYSSLDKNWPSHLHSCMESILDDTSNSNKQTKTKIYMHLQEKAAKFMLLSASLLLHISLNFPLPFTWETKAKELL